MVMYGVLYVMGRGVCGGDLMGCPVEVMDGATCR